MKLCHFFILPIAFFFHGTAVYADFGAELHHLVLRTCRQAEIGIGGDDSFVMRNLKSLEAWGNRNGYKNTHPNSDPQTYVSLDLSALKTGFSQFFSDFKITDPNQLKSMLESPAYSQALHECFPPDSQASADALHQVKVNFSERLVEQLIVGRLLGAYTLAGVSANMSSIVRWAVSRLSFGASRISQLATRQFPSATARLAPVVSRSPYSTAATVVGAMRLALLTEAAKWIYDNFSIVKSMRKTSQAILKGESGEEIRKAFFADLKEIGDQKRSEIPFSDTELAQGLQEIMSAHQTKIGLIDRVNSRLQTENQKEPNPAIAARRAEEIAANHRLRDQLVVALNNYQVLYSSLAPQKTSDPVSNLDAGDGDGDFREANK